MPGMSGRELAQRLASTRPEMKILYMSGYTDGVIADHGVLEKGISILRKPFTHAQLIQSLDGIFEERLQAVTQEERHVYTENKPKHS